MRSFVGDFYDWYVVLAQKDNAGSAWDLALRDRASAFDPTLFRELKEDADARAKGAGEIVGLDHDPFLNSQDPCEHYEVGAIQANGEHYLADIIGVCSGKRSENPDVVAGIAREKNGWVFVNFHDPSHQTDLRTELVSLRAIRQKP